MLTWTNAEGLTDFSTDTGLAGGAAYDAHGVAITDEDVAKAKAADAVIFGAVGAVMWIAGGEFPAWAAVTRWITSAT